MLGIMKKDLTKNHILDTAVDLFWRHSYNGVSMNDLSRAAGVNKATVYQHFSSKEDLTVAALNRAAKRTEDYIYRDTFNEVDTPKERLKAIYHKVYQMHVALHADEGKCRGCPFVNLGVELSTTSEPIRKAVDTAFASFRNYYAQIANNDAEIGASLMATMNGALVASKIENRPAAILDGQKRALMLLPV